MSCDNLTTADPRLVCPGCGGTGQFTGIEHETAVRVMCPFGVQWRVRKTVAEHHPLVTCPACGKAGGEVVAGMTVFIPAGGTEYVRTMACVVCRHRWTDPPGRKPFDLGPLLEKFKRK